MKVRADRKQLLALDEPHDVPVQTHRHRRGHQAHLDVTEHRDPNVLIAVDFEVSTDGGETWVYGGGFTKQGGGRLVDKNGDPEVWVHAVFGHEPTPRHRDWRGQWAGQDPAPHRLVRGTVRVMRTPPAVLAAQSYAVPAPAPLGAGGNLSDDAPVTPLVIPHPAPGLAALFAARPIAPVRTRLHVVGIAGVDIDKAQIPQA